MVLLPKISGAAALALLAGLAAAHPGESHSDHHMKREITAREHNAHLGARSLGACSNSVASRKLKARSIKRRSEHVEKLRQKRGITAPSKKFRRDLEDLQAWEAVSHNQTGIDSYDMFTPLADVFDANTSCILAPEVTDGPYYVVGEYMRSNVKESLWSEGVDLFLEVQYIDVNTCLPVPRVAVDIWNCNATGLYSGISTSGNYAADGLNSTYLRGIQMTDHDGVVQFETIFPGHYEGRATHTHLLAHMNATVQTNGTISVWDAPVTHIGQLFYPEALRSEVELLAPYNTNTQAITSNDDDMWSIVQTDSSYDPMPEFVYLGEDISEGLFAWIQIGVNASVDYTSDSYYAIAAYLDADGGHASANSMGGAPSGGGNSTAPSGAPPSGSGAVPSATASA
ncbi:aromatic compound dioxygenase [Thozetella sp. PMI_491]|nr:aromatic compound dioxygenase [Thozetella sp. PMI_491]